MKVDITEDRIIRFRDVFSGVMFETEEGEKLGVCMRDGGFEISVKDQSIKSDTEYYQTYSILGGVVTRINQVAESSVDNPDSA